MLFTDIRIVCLNLERAKAVRGYSFDKDGWTSAIGENSSLAKSRAQSKQTRCSGKWRRSGCTWTSASWDSESCICHPRARQCIPSPVHTHTLKVHKELDFAVDDVTYRLMLQWTEELLILSMHVAAVRCFVHEGLCQLQSVLPLFIIAMWMISKSSF